MSSNCHESLLTTCCCSAEVSHRRDAGSREQNGTAKVDIDLSFPAKLQPIRCTFRLKIRVGNLPVAQWFGMRIAEGETLKNLLLATIQNCTKSLKDGRM